MTNFIKGLKLSEMFFKEVVQTIIKESFSNLKYAAALIGAGSEVLSYDTEMSTDHHWGPRVMLFLEEQSYHLKDNISKILSEKLPPNFHGYSTHFTEPNNIGIQLLSKAKDGQAINHRVEIHTIGSFFINT
ncbi:MAG: hypothetical protein COB02_17735 [Candidatus Cloacimonadota bacterium]|nr:MAG: hypothetical protein COB02_17735 [Candidatus Cloacimonadota bacterium]